MIVNGDVDSWETINVYVETEYNVVSVRLLKRDAKYIYTHINKNSPVKATDIFNRFPKMDVERILYDLRDSYLIYFVRGEVK